MVVTGGAVAGACTLLRWYLDRSSRRPRTALNGWVEVTALWNRGSAFGLLPVGSRALAVLSAALLPVTAALGRRSPLGAGLVLGGGVSNLWERVRYGRVYDYLRFPRAPKPLRRYVFNAADLAIFSGVALLAAGAARGDTGRKKRRKES